MYSQAGSVAHPCARWYLDLAFPSTDSCIRRETPTCTPSRFNRGQPELVMLVDHQVLRRVLIGGKTVRIRHPSVRVCLATRVQACRLVPGLGARPGGGKGRKSPFRVDLDPAFLANFLQVLKGFLRGDPGSPPRRVTPSCSCNVQLIQYSLGRLHQVIPPASHSHGSSPKLSDITALSAASIEATLSIKLCT